MALVTVAELQEALGIGDQLYDESIVQSCCDTANIIVDGLLTHNRAPISHAQLLSNIATVTTIYPHGFVVGQIIVVTDVGTPFNGTNTITAVTPLTISWAETNADINKFAIVPNGMATIQYDVDYSNTANVKMAALIVAEEVWVARQSPFGGSNSIDGTPSPFKMGPSLMKRVSSLISSNRDVRGLIG
jgi:hypothetical protein